MALHECARMEMTMCKCAVSSNVCVFQGDCGGRRNVWSVGQQDVRDRNGTCSQFPVSREATRKKLEPEQELVGTEAAVMAGRPSE